MLVFAGLGNPGINYAANRHNAGFMAVNCIAKRHSFPEWKKKGSSLISIGRIEEKKIILVKPQNYMNKSGLPLLDVIRFHKSELHNIFVFHDELDLDAGKLRVKIGGGNGGHNGLRDVDRHIGVDYWRIRIGIGRPPYNGKGVNSWVLSNFDRDEREGWVTNLLDAIAEEAGHLVRHDVSGFMTRIAHLAPSLKKNKIKDSLN